MKSAGKIISIVASMVLIGVLGFCTVWTVRNWSVVYSSIDGSSIYTYEDIEQARNEAYAEGTKNENEYKKTLAELRSEIISLQNENSKLTKENAIYQNFVESYNKEGISVVSYEVDGVLLDLLPVNNSVTLSTVLTTKEVPAKVGHDFVGWSLDGQTVLDPANYMVTENIVLNAVYEAKTYSVKFYVDSNGIDDKLENEELLFEVGVKYGNLIPTSSLEQAKSLAIENYTSNYLENEDLDKLVVNFHLVNPDIYGEIDYSTYCVKTDLIITFYFMFDTTDEPVNKPVDGDLSEYF